MAKKHLNSGETIDLLEFADQIGCKELHMVTDYSLGLKGVVAIYSTKLGPALGGCRFLPYESSNLAAMDAMRLAKSMALKSAIADLPLGGGKTVLIQPKFPEDLVTFERSKVLREFGRFLNTLNGRYITAVDSGTCVGDMDEIAAETEFVTSTSKFPYTIPDPSVMTARGVVKGMLAAAKFKFAASDLQGVRVAVQGVGHVGYYLVKMLHDLGAKITICDIHSKSIDRCVTEFKGVKVVSDPEKIYQTEAEIFSPCALGGVLNTKSISKLKAQIVAGAANNQLQGYEHAEQLYQQNILYAPDFVINAGGVIYVAGPVLKQTEVENLQKVDNIYNILLKVFECHAQQKLNTHDIAYAMALDKLKE
jgi:leucine dehydrogenase